MFRFAGSDKFLCGDIRRGVPSLISYLDKFYDASTLLYEVREFDFDQLVP